MSKVPNGFYAWPIRDAAGEVAAYWVYRGHSRSPCLMKPGGYIFDPFKSSDEGVRFAEFLDTTVDDNLSHDERLDRIAAEPEVYAINYGLITGRCGVCNRRLKTTESKERGIGPECLKKIKKSP